MTNRISDFDADRDHNVDAIPGIDKIRKVRNSEEIPADVQQKFEAKLREMRDQVKYFDHRENDITTEGYFDGPMTQDKIDDLKVARDHTKNILECCLGMNTDDALLSLASAMMVKPEEAVPQFAEAVGEPNWNRTVGCLINYFLSQLLLERWEKQLADQKAKIASN